MTRPYKKWSERQAKLKGKRRTRAEMLQKRVEHMEALSYALQMVPLLAGEMTNREMAKVLEITVPSIQYIRRKLGIRARAPRAQSASPVPVVVAPAKSLTERQRIERMMQLAGVA